MRRRRLARVSAVLRDPGGVQVASCAVGSAAVGLVAGTFLAYFVALLVGVLVGVGVFLFLFAAAGFYVVGELLQAEAEAKAVAQGARR